MECVDRGGVLILYSGRSGRLGVGVPTLFLCAYGGEYLPDFYMPFGMIDFGWEYLPCLYMPGGVGRLGTGVPTLILYSGWSG